MSALTLVSPKSFIKRILFIFYTNIFDELSFSRPMPAPRMAGDRHADADVGMAGTGSNTPLRPLLRSG
jgi:hypothetical protein